MLVGFTLVRWLGCTGEGKFTYSNRTLDLCYFRDDNESTKERKKGTKANEPDREYGHRIQGAQQKIQQSNIFPVIFPTPHGILGGNQEVRECR